MYLDESGDHNLDKIDPRYPMFVLGGIIVDRSYVRTVMGPRIRRLKDEFLGDPGIVLHTTDISRARNGFESLKDPGFRREFYAELNAMMRELEYQVVACVIDKPKLAAQYRKHASDPYHYSLEVLVERFWEELGECTDGGIIYAEKRGEPLDYALLEAWEQLRQGIGGIGYVGGRTIDERICELVLKEKRLNIDGLQLADLVVSPIARRGMRMATRDDWEIVKSKLRRGPTGKAKGYGLIVLPSSKK